MRYYDAWVRPRCLHLARDEASSLQLRTRYSPNVSTWLDHGHLVTEKLTNWKNQYRLQQNWSTGVFGVSEVEFHDSAQVCLCAGLFVVSGPRGLQVRAANKPARILASISFTEETKILFKQPKETFLQPSALAVDKFEDRLMIVVGFLNGEVSQYVFDVETRELFWQSLHRERSAEILQMAIKWPYLIINFKPAILSIYRLHNPDEEMKRWSQLTVFRNTVEIGSLHISLRTTALDTVASIVYSFPHNGCGWAVGLQEHWINRETRQVTTRVEDTVQAQYINFAGTRVPSIIHKRRPESMSYSHPYLLTSHSDNTLTMYRVTSDEFGLSIGKATRLWGHTSGVSSVKVTSRGKAVSINSRGKEMRVWELEPRPIPNDSIPMTLDPKLFNPKAEEENRLRLAEKVKLNCVAFDDERILLQRRGNDRNTQIIFCDFT